MQEIQALSQPPIPWDVELAQWFDHHFPPRERRRTYARPSRRQAATPDIPRPRLVPVEDDALRTFAVVQPGLDLLDQASDFPKAGPVLIITDGACDVLRVRREHGFLVPAGGGLPFPPRGPVFRVR